MNELDWQTWRRQKRSALLARRKRLSSEDQAARDRAIDQWLAAAFADLAGWTIGFYWPIGGEPDPRPAVHRWREAGSPVALPRVVAPGAPLEFRQWHPEAEMAVGVYDIAFPVDTRVLTPEAALIPIVGVDRGGYRLGYGGGYFDRTLADYAIKPVSIGVGEEAARFDDLQPQPHDIPLDCLVTEAAIYARINGTLLALAMDEVRGHVQTLLAERFASHGPTASDPSNRNR